MIYPYKCPSCKEYHEVYKESKDAKKIERCPTCSYAMSRIWTAPYLSTQDIYTGYNPGLGKYIKNKADLKDSLKGHTDRTGTEMVEIGNEKPNIKKRNNWKFSYGEMKQIHDKLESVPA